ncbi:redox-sensitive bicupin YhaK (pirin superfamily) [Phyllobacterium ifriqiyense]|uniref:Redox-sensitive bicupin YhaK (Pirin superfamily) n=1 Tax=Phyllobacterium ifriqiyense TaxID=314238 RepID=A0ABU0SCB9_9HYPH|nr:redox-sensitive bicupin YhaK (pirin superfamily) [Phyllobacterium ifriqiyense]
MSFFPGNDPEPGDAIAVDSIETLIIPRTSDIGGLEVRRALPTAKRRLVGPFIFFDRMGPAILRPTDPLDVRPHPHIGLSTVTYLFDGNIRHRDSLGTEMVIKPGDVNLMTAGRGIVHSERSPEELRTQPLPISGLQTWLALPDHLEEIDPTFANTEASRLPVLQESGLDARVVMGQFHGASSGVKQHAETLYVDIRLEAGAHIQIPANAAEERAIYTLDGPVEIAGQIFPADRLLAFRPGDEIIISAPQGAHFMLFGGATLSSQALYLVEFCLFVEGAY